MKLGLTVAVVVTLGCVLDPGVFAQTPPVLNAQIYAGLTITGTVATVYSVEYATNLAQTNAWRCLEYLQLPASLYLWVDKAAPVTGKRFYRAVAMEPPTNMVFIPPGTFRMGSPTSEQDRSTNEGPETAVTISRGFWLGKYEVSQGAYESIMGSNPSFFNGVRGITDYGNEPQRPVEQVSWQNAQDYCGLLTQRERAAGRIATNAVYRLPTEAEWEYACRAWTSSRYSYGDDLDQSQLDNYAWWGSNSGGMTHPVGQKLPNLWGLHDMHGNVSEWCQDWYGMYSGGIAVDPQGASEGSQRMIRGGDWYSPGNDPGDCRSALRLPYFPANRSSGLGFRVVLAPGQP